MPRKANILEDEELASLYFWVLFCSELGIGEHNVNGRFPGVWLVLSSLLWWTASQTTLSDLQLLVCEPYLACPSNRECSARNGVTYRTGFQESLALLVSSLLPSPPLSLMDTSAMLRAALWRPHLAGTKGGPQSGNQQGSEWCQQHVSWEENVPPAESLDDLWPQLISMATLWHWATGPI